jgi:redox-sensitive bicupin YhaK (pirin superfamily)
MTAGRGIVHSERTGAAARGSGQNFHGLQLWVALPEESEEMEPEFFHYDRDAIPVLHYQNSTMRLVAGTVFGETSPVKTYSRLFYVDVEMPESGAVRLPNDYSERGVYIISGSLDCRGAPIEAGTMAVFNEDAAVELTASRNTRLVMLGGDPITERYLDWNFVASTRERIEQAKDDWRNGRFPIIADDAQDYIPLPQEG